MYNEWDGITQPADLNNEVLKARLSLADAARSGDWPSVLATLSTVITAEGSQLIATGFV